MNIRQLRYFIVLAEELHFRRAAERLNITQSPLTLALQELEREVGGLLFHRTQRCVELTEAGATFLVNARAILDKVQESLESTRGLLSGESGQLRLGLTPAIALLPLLAMTIRGFQKAHPNVRLTVKELSSADQLKALQSRELDACVIRMPVKRRPSAVGWIRLLRDGLVVAMHRDHPMGLLPSLTIADLKNEPLIVYPRWSRVGIYETVVQLCAKRSFTPKFAQEAKEASTILGLAAARLGIAIVPSELSRIEMPEIVFVPLTDEDAATDIYLTFRAGEGDSRVLSLCRLAEAAAAHGLPALMAAGGGRP